MSVGDRLPLPLSDVDPVVAVCLPIVVAPFGHLIGWLFVSHVVSDETRAVWLTTVALITLALLAASLRS